MHRVLRSIAVGLALWGLLPQPVAAQTAQPSLSDPSLLLGPVLVLAVAMWALATWMWSRRQKELRQPDPPLLPFPWPIAAIAVTAFIATLAFAYIYGYAVAQRRAVPLVTLIGALSPQTFMMGFLTIVTAFFLCLVVLETRREPPHIETHWGGFGGGLGGWTFSRAIIYLIVAIVFGTLLMGHSLSNLSRTDSSARTTSSPGSPGPSKAPNPDTPPASAGSK